MGSRCWSCGEGSVSPDPGSGAVVCTSCGLEHDAGASEFYNLTVVTEDGQLDFCAASVVHHLSESPYHELKLTAASNAITSMVVQLGLSATRAEEILTMAKSATDGNLTTPGTAFLPALAAACSFLVARSHRLPLSLAEATEAASCTTVELGDLVSRISSHLSLPPLPSFDYYAALERALLSSYKLTTAAGDEKMSVILSQARFLLRCASKWSLTTGRHPLPLITGLIAFAAELNGLADVSMEEIAQEMSVVMHTARLRYKEIVNALVRVAQKLLPWGADVNARNLLLNAPMLLHLMEMRSQIDPSERFLESFTQDMADIVQVYSSVDEDESKYLQTVPLDVDDLDFENSRQEGKESMDLKILEDCLSDAYQNVLKRLSKLKELGEVGKVASRRNQRRIGLELEPWMDSLDDDWSKRLPLEEVADIDIGYNAPPPSFTAGLQQKKRRRARIVAAKCRIDAIRKAPAARTANTIDSPSVHGNEDAYPSQKNSRKKLCRKRQDGEHLAEMSGAPDSGKKKRKRDPFDGIDREDCVIEVLLLHGANEVEIEQGQYRRLLELHVFNAMCMLIFVGNNGETYFNTAALVSCVQNFPKNHGPIVGILKGFAGLSGAILTQVYAIVHSPDDVALIFMVAVGPTMVVIALMFIVRVVNGHRQVRSSDGTSFTFVYSVCLVLAAYLMGVMLLEDLVGLGHSLTILCTVILMVLLLVPIVIPIMLSFFSSDDESAYTTLLTSPRREEASGSVSSEEQEVILSEVDEQKPKEIDLLLASERQKRIAELQAKLFQAAAVGVVRVKRRKGPRRAEDFTLLQAMIKADFWLLFFSLLLRSGSGLTVIDNLGQMSQSLGFEDSHIFVSMISIWNFLGRVSGGFFLEIIVKDYAYPRAIALATAQVFMAIGNFIFAMGWPGTMYIGTLLIGLGYGTHWAIVLAAASKLFGVKNFGALYNFLIVANPAGSLVFSGIIASGIYDYEARKQANYDHNSTLLAMPGRLLGVVSDVALALKCKGSICFFISSLIMSGFCIIAAVLSLTLVHQTKIMYKNLYGKPQT